MPKRNGVIINVYEESRNSRSDQKIDTIKRISPKEISSQPRLWKTRGYDRRAQLLAYAQELRHADSQQLHFPFDNSRRKSKIRKVKNEQKWRWKVTVEKIKRLFSRFDGIKRTWKYESIVRDDCSDGEESCNQESVKKSTKGRRHSYFWSTKGRRGRRHSYFWKKLRCLLKKISRAWKCSS